MFKPFVRFWRPAARAACLALLLPGIAAANEQLADRFSIDHGPGAIGSSRANDLRLNDTSVAPHHATLLLKGDTWYITDLRSRHGTFVNGYRVATERALAPGCSLTVGHVTLIFRAKKSMPNPEPEQAEGLVRKFWKFLMAS